MAIALTELVHKYYNDHDAAAFQAAFHDRLRKALLAIALLFLIDLTTSQLAADYELRFQEEYLYNFVADLEANRYTEAKAITRAKLYASALPKFYNQLWLQSQGDRLLAWKYSPEAAHCGDCIELDGTVRKASEWYALGLYPRSGETECLSNCKCEFISV